MKVAPYVTVLSIPVSRVEYPYSHSYSAGASLIYGSAHDLALFSMLHLNSLKNTKVISERSVEEMQDTVARNGSQHYGLGWWINDDYYGYKGLLAQGGTYFGSAWVQLIPSERVAVIVLSNTGRGEPKKIIEETLSTLLPKFKEKLTTAQSVKKGNGETTLHHPPRKWRGVLRTYKGDVPIGFSFNGSDDSFADIGDRKQIAIPKVQIRKDGFAYVVEGDLDLDDVGAGPYNLNFYLKHDEDILYGHMETRASAHADTPTLPFWVEMRKVE